MPASPTATHDHIKDVNTRYHDAAADEYDAKWGIDFGETGKEQVRLKLDKALGGLDGERFGDGLEIGSGTGYFSINLVQLGIIERLTATDISPGMLERLSKTAETVGVEVETVVTWSSPSDSAVLANWSSIPGEMSVAVSLPITPSCTRLREKYPVPEPISSASA